MNCKYCGASIPSTSRRCPNCGRMPTKEQIEFLKEFNKNSEWDKYSNKNTAMYKSENAYERKNKIGIILVPLVILLLLVIAFIKVIGK